MQELAEILNETDRLEEAISWFEKEFVLLLGNIPLVNSLMKTNCRNLGLCYARLERYEEAMLHFRHMIERLTIDDPQSTDARLEFIHEINDWMNKVEQMLYAALYTDPEEGATSEGTPREDPSDKGSFNFENLNYGA
jgi:tetratricopeptide (TPR) repeat protein